MRTSPDFYLQKDNTIIAFAQDVKPKGILIDGYDYENQKWVSNSAKIKEYLKENKTIKIIKKESV